MKMKWITGIFLSTTALAALAPSVAAAQDNSAAAQSPVLDEIVVTAQKRSERLSDVPLSITAVSGEQLLARGITSAEDLARVVPGFNAQRSEFGVPIYTMRGIGFTDPNVLASPAVAIYVDQVALPISAMARGASLDLERVEALKGPQGTLFGQNSTGGLINYIAAKPTEELTGGFNLDIGRFREVNAEAFISGSLTPELRARVAVRSESRDDWQRGYEPNDNTLGQSGAELGERHFYNGRAILEWTPSSDVSLQFTANGWIDQSDTQAQQFRGFAPSTPRNPFNGGAYDAYAGFVPTPRDPRLAGWNEGTDYARDDYFYQFALRGDFNLSDTVTLTSISAYSRYHEDSITDVDATAYLDQEVNVNADVESYSQELRLTAEVGRFDFTIGANYATDDASNTQLARSLATNNGFGSNRWLDIRQSITQDNETIAAFGSVDFHLTDQLTLQGGLRYTRQQLDFEGCLADAGDGRLAAAFAAGRGIPATAGNCVTTLTDGTLPPIVPLELNEDNLSWRASINWKPDQDSLLYANITRGYKAGSFPILPAVTELQFFPATQESLLAYETGFKTALADRRVQLSGAVFYYDYTDKQTQGSVSLLGTTLRRLVNIPESRVWGGELDVTVMPVDGLRLNGAVTYVNSRVESDPPRPIDPFGRPTTFVGEPFPGTPEWHVNADAEYRFAAGDDLEAFIGGSMSYRSASQPLFGESPELAIDGYTLVDLRAGIETDDGMRVSIWGRNVFNTYYQLSALHPIDSISYYMGMPATYGISFGFRFR